MAVLVDLQAVSARRADRPLFEALSLTVSTGDRLGVVGINGTGKSTLLRLVAGVELPEGGTARRGRGTRVGYLGQDPQLPAGTVQAAVGEGWEAEAVLERLGMGHAADKDVAQLSGGQAKRVALAGVLAHPAELLVLDEPTNHLDLAAVAWLEQRLLAFRGGLVLVSHDRHVLDRLTTRMLELDRGRAYLHEGGYGSYLAAAAEREEQAVAAESRRRNLARTELAWLRRGAPARTRKPRARIASATRTVEGRAEAPARAGNLELGFGTPRLGDKVLECVDLTYRFTPSAQPVVADVNLTLDPRERLGIVGLNGSGKSTLLDLIAGRRVPSAGSVELGPTAVLGYYDQQGMELDSNARVRDLVAGPTRVAGGPEDVALMERFWFTGELPFARVGTLSGGERRRLQLLLVLAGRPNVLLLDEPTNDLDLDTLRTLEDLLEEWPGALVVISHDRTFLERTTDRLMAMASGGHLEAVAGGVEGWLGRLSSLVPPRPSSAVAGDRAADGAPGHGRPSVPRRSASTVSRLLRDTEKELARLTRRRDGLGEALSESTGHQELAQLGSELAQAQAALEAAEERWLALAEEAEAAR